MASSIIEGQQYALTSQFTNKGQPLLFVKLTDSALKAIEDYAAAVSKGNVSPSFKPSIEFRPNNSQGAITIPNKVSSGEIEKQLFNFSVKDVQNDGIQECVHQRRNMSMESLGKIMLRMQIHANDDSYQNTKVKMAVAAEQELKKYNTKVIQSGDPNVGRKVKVKRPPFNSKPPQPFASLNNGGTAAGGSNLKNSPYNKANNSNATTNTTTSLKRPNSGSNNSEPLFGSNNHVKKFKSDNPPPPRLPPVHMNGKSHPQSANPSAILSHSSPLDKLNSSSGGSSNGNSYSTNNVSDHESPESRNTSFNSNSNCYKSSISLLHESSNLINSGKKGDISNDKEPYNSRVSSYQRISGNGSGSINSTPNSSPDSGISHVSNVLSSDSSVNNDADDYLSKYTKIQNNDQLAQYRSDFYNEYPEYRRLYDYVESVSRQFEELREMILSKEEESEEWHDLIRQTIEKYDEVKHKSRYNKAQKRLNYLHYKLMHIKNLINDYNRNHDKVMANLSRFGSSQLKS